jgi:hypothetical protein
MDIIKTGVNALNSKPIDKHFKKEILKSIIERIAHGRDGIAGTEDDRLSPKTVVVLLTLIENDVIDYLIDGAVLAIKKSGFTTCFKRFGIAISYKKF